MVIKTVVVVMVDSWLTFQSITDAVKQCKPPGMQASIFGACPKPGQIGRVEAARASGVKMGG